MTESEASAMMERHGITATHRVVYQYRGFNYTSLGEALEYAELVTSRANDLAAPKTGENKRSDRG